METLADLTRSFLRDLKAEGRAPRTLEIYTESVEQYRRWLRGRGHPETLESLTRVLLREWFAELSETKQAGTVATRFRGLRRFCRWLAAEDVVLKSPMEGMQSPTPKGKPVPVLSDEQLAAILRACQGKGFYPRRDEAIFRVLIDTGVRASELCSLKLEDLDLDNEAAAVTGKGGKRRAIYFSAKTVRALDRYIRERKLHKDSSSPFLFLGLRGAIATPTLRRLCAVKGAAAGIKGLHVHQFRHTAANHWLLSAGGERNLKRIMGWESDVMLSHYASSAADARARDAARRLAPGDRV